MRSARPWILTAAIAGGVVALPALGLAGLYQLAIGVFRVGDVGAPSLPAAAWAAPVGPPRARTQGWTPAQARDFHHRGQGTVILPLSWFLALEQPLATPLQVDRFADPDYLHRFGFNDDGAGVGDGDGPDDDGGPAPAVAAGKLPIGFAVEPVTAPWADLPWKFAAPTQVVGLTCAACHTGRLDLVRDGVIRSALIEGGAAMIDLKEFQDALGRALGLTQMLPERFRRFADRVAADPRGAPADEATIRSQLDALIAQGSQLIAFSKENHLFPVEAGFGRTDALDLIGNRVFGVHEDRNQSVADAPVNYPHLWDASWFDWVQYNASIRMPMARNIGEALGVMALFKADPPGPGADLLGRVYSSVNVKNLDKLEQALGGDDPLADPSVPNPGLQPPRWGEVMADLAGVPVGSPLPDPLALDPAMVADGRALYKQHCQGCHLPPRDDLKALLRANPDDLKALLRANPDLPSPDDVFSVADRVSHKRFLKLRVVDLDEVGTDPNHAMNFYRRVVVGLDYPSDSDRPLAEGEKPRRIVPGTIPGTVGLYRVTSLLRKSNYATLGMTGKDNSALRLKFDRYRSVPEVLDADARADNLAGQLDRGDPAAIKGMEAMGDVIRPNLGYKARPLDGIWATPPYLHNGSVPTLDDLLRPAAERPRVFYTGSTTFDPVKVGYRTDAFPGATRFDTAVSGNRNTGHEFRDLTVPEIEAALHLVPGPDDTDDRRRARILGMSPEEFARLDPRAVRGLLQQAGTDPARVPRPILPVPGRLGPALGVAERARLLAYLKSI